VTKREKVMIMVLFAFVLMFIYYDILLNPRLKQIKSLREEKYLLEGQMSNIEYNMNEGKLNEANVEGLSKELKLLSTDFFDYIEEEDVINIIDEIINKSGINIGSISITSDDLNSGEANTMSIPLICITLSYRDGFTKLMNFIAEVENYHKEIIIKNLSIVSGEVFEMTGSVTLELYYFSVRGDKKNTILYTDAKRNNPFVKITEKNPK